MSLTPSLYVISNRSGARFDFSAPGSSGTSAATSLCIQPGTFSKSTDQDGNILHTFQAFQRTPSFEDERQFDTLRRLQLLFYEANQVSENGVDGRRITLTYAPKGAPQAMTFAVLSGFVSRVDDEIVDRFNSRRAVLYDVFLRLVPNGEFDVVQDTFLNVD
jgi:hypothetical protein